MSMLKNVIKLLILSPYFCEKPVCELDGTYSYILFNEVGGDI